MSYLDSAILFSPYKIASEDAALRLHEQAMDIAQNADQIHQQKDIEVAQEMYRLSFVIESAVARWAIGNQVGNNTLHRVLIQSAYALAQSSNDAESIAGCLADFPELQLQQSEKSS
jgi:hypothetical protein